MSWTTSGSLQLPMEGAFIPQKGAKVINQGFFLGVGGGDVEVELYFFSPAHH